MVCACWWPARRCAPLAATVLVVVAGCGSAAHASPAALVGRCPRRRPGELASVDAKSGGSCSARGSPSRRRASSTIGSTKAPSSCVPTTSPSRWSRAPSGTLRRPIPSKAGTRPRKPAGSGGEFPTSYHPRAVRPRAPLSPTWACTRARRAVNGTGRYSSRCAGGLLGVAPPARFTLTAGCKDRTRRLKGRCRHGEHPATPATILPALGARREHGRG